MFRDLRHRISADDLRPALIAIMRGEDGCMPLVAIPSLDLETPASEIGVRERIAVFAWKLLARVTGHIQDATMP